MKTTTSFLLLFSLFLLAFSIKYSPVLAQGDPTPEPVRDITGKVLRTGIEYYILPVIRGSGGGVTLAKNRNGSCPLDVIQEPLEVSEGLPVTFTPDNPKKGIIRLSTDLNIKFSAITICNQTTVWRLGDFDQSIGQTFISTNGVEGTETLENWFKIVKDGDDYKFFFCPKACDFCPCGDIGIYVDVDGTRNLAFLINAADVPFKIMFKRA